MTTLSITETGAMRLMELTLHNFKGQSSFALAPKGAHVDIFADNGVGKTTLADALFWLLFDKDSQNRKDFEIKTIDSKTGEPIHGLDHEVSATFGIAGESLTLTKTYREVWTKPRGAAKKEFTGHTTDYKVNGVPVQKKEYDQRLAGICDEKLFRLLSDPGYFPAVITWQERRKLLLTVCGDITDSEVIASNIGLRELPGIIGKHSLDDYRKIAQARRKEINSEIERIPTRIDEAKRAVESVPDIAPDLDALRAALQTLSEERAQIAAGGAIATKTVELREVEAAIQDAITKARADAMAGCEEARKAYSLASEELASTESALKAAKGALAYDQELYNRIAAGLESLRQSYRAISAEEWTGTEICGACGQPLPPEKIDAAKGNFNQIKARKLEQNKESGVAEKARLTDLQEKLAIQRSEIEALEAAVPVLSEAKGTAKASIDTAAANVAPVPDGLTQQRAQIESELQAMKIGQGGELSQIDEKIGQARRDVQDAEGIEARRILKANNEKRIEELELQERTLAAEIEELDAHLYLTEEFIRAKVSALEEKINSKFQIARFKLFDPQVNGAIAECCEVAVSGVPYGSLNHGMRLNVGLDIINVLSDHFGFAPPIVVDNAESVTRIHPTRGQQIRLIVSEKDKALRVEVHA